MGYGMNLMESTATILVANQSKALEAIKTLAGKETISGYGGSPHFSWVTTKEFLKARHIEDALRAWRWDGYFDDDGNLLIVYFLGEKYGDDNILFEAIAPFVEDGGYIQMQGEDGCVWRWLFKDGKLEEQTGRIVFD